MDLRGLCYNFPFVFLQDALKDGTSGGNTGCSSSSSESFKRLPKKRKFDLSDFENQESESISLPVTTASPISTASVVTYSSSSSPAVSSHPVISSPVVVHNSGEREIITQNAPLPSSMPSNCQSTIVANSRHVNTIHSTAFLSQQQSVVVRESGSGELRSPENIQHLKPASAIVLHSSQNTSVPRSISQPVIVTSSPGLNSHPSHIINTNSESYSLPPKAAMLSNLSYERAQPSTISTAHHVIKSPTSYVSTSHSHQSQGLSVRDQTPEPVIYSSPYGPTQNRAIITQQPSTMYKVSGTSVPNAALSPPNSVLAIARQDSSPHVHSQVDQQPMDLGCRSSGGRIGVHHAPSLSPSQHCQPHQQSGHPHYGAISQQQQQTVVTYRSRSPSPQTAYRVQHIQAVHQESIPSSQGQQTQSQQYGSSAFRHHLSPSKVCGAIHK